MAWTFYQFYLWPLDVMIKGYQISELVLSRIIFQRIKQKCLTHSPNKGLVVLLLLSQFLVHVYFYDWLSVANNIYLADNNHCVKFQYVLVQTGLFNKTFQSVMLPSHRTFCSECVEKIVQEGLNVLAERISVTKMDFYLNVTISKEFNWLTYEQRIIVLHYSFCITVHIFDGS